MSTPGPINTSIGRTTGHENANAGKTTIEDGVVAKIAGLAARDVPGVHALGGGAARALGAIRGALNSRDLAQGVGVEVGDTQVAVDLTIVAEYPVSLQGVAADVREAVYKAMEDLVGLEVTEVNVIINDVHIPSEDAESTEPPVGEPRVQRS
ncbi:Asp23/Gls24 family envelope stress response protein [Paeniglutamicibacter cryotolerans]|uniref:Putative alkaline shock family protein YloU n=1 Tax=Paeniglutamicibacter cryotolerans TaxID=670079 RepID=A0A839QGE6_9MICC|nr:Asp23/Gls24 family envelope stress response protein [Paeniglutamicibacter cryotolerans]MBB2995398.1 putative alkaline shock family protein YloU [Paeniglutamicibacter cryotolerans]